MKRKLRGALGEKIIEIVLFLSACSAVFIVFLITIFVFREGYSAINMDLLFGLTWNPSINLYGLLPTTISTIIVGVGSVVIATLIGVPCAIFLAEFCPYLVRNVIKPSVEVLVGIPSVVLGFVGLMALVPWIRYTFGGWGESILAGWIILAIMSMPHIITISEDAMRAVPNSYREASLALGATKWQTVIRVILPNAKSGILASIVLGIGRAIGETMAVMMVIGNPYVPWIPTSILDRVRVLTSTMVIEMGYVEWGSPHYHALFAIGVVLFILVAALNAMATLAIRRGFKK